MKIVETRHDTAANWTALNPVLANEETGYEDDTGKFKVGNGTAAWNALSYALPTGLGAQSVGTAPDSDKLDGLDSSAFLRVNAKAADSDKLDGLDSSAFLLAGAKAADSELLDGIDSAGFFRAGVGPTTLNPATLPQSYPQGFSIGYFAGDGPDNTYCNVITVRGGTDVSQIASAVFSGNNRTYQRIANGGGNVWSAWRSLHDAPWASGAICNSNGVGFTPPANTDTTLAFAGATDADDGSRDVYADGTGLTVRRAGRYVVSAFMLTPYDAVFRTLWLFGGNGGPGYLAIEGQANKQFWNLCGTNYLPANTQIRLAVNSPSGTLGGGNRDWPWIRAARIGP